MVNELTELQDAAVLRLGGISLTLGGLLTAAIIIAIAGALSWATTRAIRRLRHKATRSTQALYLLEKMAGYGILIAGLFMGLSAAGLNLSSLAVFAGAIGIGLGLGLQGVVKEFVSGLFLIFDRMVSSWMMRAAPLSRSGRAPRASAPMTTSTSSSRTPA